MPPRQAAAAPHRASDGDDVSIDLVCAALLTMTMLTHLSGLEPLPFFLSLFTEVPGRGILRTSPFGHSPKLDARSCIAEVLTPQILPASFLPLDGETGHTGPNFAFCLPGRM